MTGELSLGDTPRPLVTEALGPHHRDALVELFRAAHSSCFCRFWHFEGTNNAWLDRCANEPDVNRSELDAAIAAGRDEARGVIALSDGMAVGWMKVTPAPAMRKAYERRLYRRLPCFEGDRTGVFLLGCFLVHPDHRRRGVARALVAAAVSIAPGWGARALEALPRRPHEPVSDEELWTGPMGAFGASGFEEVNAFEPYPVLRLVLPPADR